MMFLLLVKPQKIDVGECILLRLVDSNHGAHDQPLYIEIGEKT